MKIAWLLTSSGSRSGIPHDQAAGAEHEAHNGISLKKRPKTWRLLMQRGHDEVPSGTTRPHLGHRRMSLSSSAETTSGMPSSIARSLLAALVNFRDSAFEKRTRFTSISAA